MLNHSQDKDSANMEGKEIKREREKEKLSFDAFIRKSRKKQS